MKKFLKVLGIVALIVVPILGVVSYIMYPAETKEFFNNLLDLVSKPLPVVGISLTVIFFFVYKCFVASKYGQEKINYLKEKINECELVINEKTKEIKETKDEALAMVNAHQSEIDLLEEYLVRLCGFSINKKAKELGDEILTGYQEKKTEIINNLDQYKTEIILNNEKSMEHLIKSLEDKIEGEINKIREEMQYGKDLDCDTEEE